ncbi:unnamed protein product [Agarophyton chilense]|eukprot:gb/GEZJ01000716.1/.p1 GENE.gb/GEZJ01000716.1/~~gb/GEZJ01000716.1/.p1  ORF type:complete len:557 (-),score=33.19 gb/GEZJ01000716.1/:1063-2694(-)
MAPLRFTATTIPSPPLLHPIHKHYPSITAPSRRPRRYPRLTNPPLSSHNRFTTDSNSAFKLPPLSVPPYSSKPHVAVSATPFPLSSTPSVTHSRPTQHPSLPPPFSTPAYPAPTPCSASPPLEPQIHSVPYSHSLSSPPRTFLHAPTRSSPVPQRSTYPHADYSSPVTSSPYSAPSVGSAPYSTSHPPPPHHLPVQAPSVPSSHPIAPPRVTPPSLTPAQPVAPHSVAASHAPPYRTEAPLFPTSLYNAQPKPVPQSYWSASGPVTGGAQVRSLCNYNAQPVTSTAAHRSHVPNARATSTPAVQPVARQTPPAQSAPARRPTPVRSRSNKGFMPPPQPMEAVQHSYKRQRPSTVNCKSSCERVRISNITSESSSCTPPLSGAAVYRDHTGISRERSSGAVGTADGGGERRGQEEHTGFSSQGTAQAHPSYDVRRMQLTRDNELQRLQTIAAGKIKVKMNLRGRTKIEQWLQRDDVVTKATALVVRMLRLDAAILSYNSSARKTALEKMSNEELRLLEALMIRLGNRNGHANWLILTDGLNAQR